jgi:hypothetical protein
MRTRSTMTHDKSDDDDMLTVVAEETAKRAGSATSKAQALSRVNNSFRDSVHCSARHYPVAQAIQEWKLCQRVLCMQTLHKHQVFGLWQAVTGTGGAEVASTRGCSITMAAGMC